MLVVLSSILIKTTQPKYGKREVWKSTSFDREREREKKKNCYTLFLEALVENV